MFIYKIKCRETQQQDLLLHAKVSLTFLPLPPLLLYEIQFYREMNGSGLLPVCSCCSCFCPRKPPVVPFPEQTVVNWKWEICSSWVWLKARSLCCDRNVILWKCRLLVMYSALHKDLLGKLQGFKASIGPRSYSDPSGHWEGQYLAPFP